MEATATGVESGSRRNRTSLGASRWRGSSFCEKVTVADTLSSTVTVWIRGGKVSWTKAQSSPASEVPLGTRAVA